MFHFKRRTLWIIIYLTIPLIFVLHELTPQPARDAVAALAELGEFDIAAIKTDCSAALCYLPLPATNLLLLSVISDTTPIKRPLANDLYPLVEYQEANRQVLSAMIFNDQLPDLLRALEPWLLAGGEHQWAATGKLSTAQQQNLQGFSATTVVAGQPIAPTVASNVTMLEAPPFGHPDHLAFLLWAELLQQRLAGNGLASQWDRRSQPHRLLLPTPIDLEYFALVSAGELRPLLENSRQAVARPRRTVEQLHRFLIASQLYELPFQYFAEQPERLNQVSLAAVNRMREFSIAQITHQIAR